MCIIDSSIFPIYDPLFKYYHQEVDFINDLSLLKQNKAIRIKNKKPNCFHLFLIKNPLSFLYSLLSFTWKRQFKEAKKRIMKKKNNDSLLKITVASFGAGGGT